MDFVATFTWKPTKCKENNEKIPNNEENKYAIKDERMKVEWQCYATLNPNLSLPKFLGDEHTQIFWENLLSIKSLRIRPYNIIKWANYTLTFQSPRWNLRKLSGWTRDLVAYQVSDNTFRSFNHCSRYLLQAKVGLTPNWVSVLNITRWV